MRLTSLIFAIIFIFSLFGMSEGAEFSMRPSIMIGEEYNDNIHLQKDKIDDYITRVQPSIELEYREPRWELDLSYLLDFSYYAKGTRTDDLTHAIDAKGHMEILREFFFLNIKDSYRRVSLDIARDFTKESQFERQSDRNIFDLNPYFVLKPGSLITVTTGYIFSDIWYKEETAVNRREYIAYSDLVYELSSRVTLNAGYKYTQDDAEEMDYSKNDVSFGSRYNYAGESFVFITVGNSWLDFDKVKSSSQIFWNAGITHIFPAVTVSLESALEYIQDPDGSLVRRDNYVMSVRKVGDKISLGTYISFREFRNAVNKMLDTRSYGIGGDCRYEFTSRLAGTVNFTYERFEEELFDAKTRSYRPVLKIEYILSEGLTLAFIDQYTDSYSLEIEENNYKNNRVMVQVKKDF
ncbi:hypothetical protein BMS3Abin10_01889 [bacterium BMS3Abin10]|nr:hypothetical protein BMS3Abin10_01889 [bacterium BMS3Abin10]GBE38257.1 hypothetical protein BMS3Bbin08_00860 [bacterium BMS3Bbin08]